MNTIKNSIAIQILLSGLIVSSAMGETKTNNSLPLNQIRSFAEVFEKIKNSYVEEVADTELLENAIHGMLEGLDPHSAFLDAESYQELQEGTAGEFGGLGIEVVIDNELIRVIAPIDDTPADLAGIKAGDLIIRIDNKPVKGMSLNDAIKLMRGPSGTEVLLTITRESEKLPINITITRDIITLKSVKSRIVEPGLAYIRVANFQYNTVRDLVLAIKELKKTSPAGLEGLILDIRNNPGGILNAAVGVSDMFLEHGIIVYTKGRDTESRLEFNAKAPDIVGGIPLIVLVNSGSASASEIVAGALQDHKRALIMGQQTFGKGSVQTVLPMINNTAIKLTTARYYTPSGRSIQVDGITPDIIIKDVKLLEKNEPAINDSIKEGDLSGHLVNNGSDRQPAVANAAVEAAPPATEPPLIEQDYQLYVALNALKAFVFKFNTSKE